MIGMDEVQYILEAIDSVRSGDATPDQAREVFVVAAVAGQTDLMQAARVLMGDALMLPGGDEMCAA